MFIPAGGLHLARRPAAPEPQARQPGTAQPIHPAAGPPPDAARTGAGSPCQAGGHLPTGYRPGAFPYAGPCPIGRRNGYKDGRPDRPVGAGGGRPGPGGLHGGDRKPGRQAGQPPRCKPRVRDGTEDAAAPAVTCKSRGLPAYAGQMPPTARIQRGLQPAASARPAAAVRRRPAHRDHQGDNDDSPHDRGPGSRAGPAGPAARGAPASAAPDARRARPGAEPAEPGHGAGPEMVRR